MIRADDTLKQFLERAFAYDDHSPPVHMHLDQIPSFKDGTTTGKLLDLLLVVHEAVCNHPRHLASICLPLTPSKRKRSTWTSTLDRAVEELWGYEPPAVWIYKAGPVAVRTSPVQLPTLLPGGFRTKWTCEYNTFPLDLCDGEWERRIFITSKSL